MAHMHDPRRIPIDPAPESAGLLESVRTWLAIGLSRRNRREATQAAAAAANRQHREREAATRAAMTGESIAAAGVKALGRVGAK